MDDPLVAKIRVGWPPEKWQAVTTIVGVSGGADSVAMLRSLRLLKQDGPGELVVGHFNHQLRGADSERDEAFVGELCESLQLRCIVGRPPEQGPALESAEAASRNQRYGFFEAIAHQNGARYVATAHTSNDQAETILHRVVRGTGIAGLAGIPRIRKVDDTLSVVRPLLACSRIEVLDFLARLSQPFQEDLTNQDRDFTRNRIRHELLPQLAAQYNPQVVEALNRLAAVASETQAAVDDLASDLLTRANAVGGENSIVLQRRPLQTSAPVVVRQALVQLWTDQAWPLGGMSLQHWETLIGKLRGSELFVTDLPGAVTLEASAEVCRLRRGK